MAKQQDEQTRTTGGIIGTSAAIGEVLNRIEAATREDVTVLILGESGTGKELVAQLIHHKSRRSQNPFIPVNVGAITSEIGSSEIFGHVKGAFTGATDDRKGLFETADSGTLFLDEIGSMDPRIQTTLLRILENRAFRKVGGKTLQKTNARIIAANDNDLRPAVKEKRFRRDLLYRLEVFTIVVPPLRERREDIPVLIDHFLRQFSREMDSTSIEGISDEARERMQAYSWPGNVRELKNVIQSAMLLANSGTITAGHLPLRICSTTNRNPDAFRLPPELCLKDLEKMYIIQTLKIKNGNKSQTAKILGVSRRYLYNKLEEYNIPL